MESNKIRHKQSKINRIGLFSNALIRNGEIVYIKGGHILLRSDFFSSSVINSYFPISDDYVIGAILPEEEKKLNYTITIHVNQIALCAAILRL